MFILYTKNRAREIKEFPHHTTDSCRCKNPALMNLVKQVEGFSALQFLSYVQTWKHSEKITGRWFVHSSPSHFVNFLTAEGKESRRPSELNRSAPQGGHSCPHSPANLQNHNSRRHQSPCGASLSRRLIHRDGTTTGSPAEQKAPR